MVYFKKGTTSDDTRIIVRNRVYPDRSAILKLYSFVRNWGSDKKYPTFSYSSWKRALKSQCGFSSWSHRVRCKLPLGKGTQEIVYVSCEQQFAAAIDAMSQSGADLEFEIVHKYSENTLLLYDSDRKCVLTFVRMVPCGEGSQSEWTSKPWC